MCIWNCYPRLHFFHDPTITTSITKIYLISIFFIKKWYSWYSQDHTKNSPGKTLSMFVCHTN